jgi:hypothetical protein
MNPLEYVYNSRWPIDYTPRRLRNDIYEVEMPREPRTSTRTWRLNLSGSLFYEEPSVPLSRTTATEFMTRYNIPEPKVGFRRTGPLPGRAPLYEEVPEEEELAAERPQDTTDGEADSA